MKIVSATIVDTDYSLSKEGLQSSYQFNKFSREVELLEDLPEVVKLKAGLF
ncbi:hypothetical protein [Archaeoglobus profundus]|uniref:Uncharacterized protein n=1 Tax=Archaeoglobus profundus (strain DSM 5631 / JCM 9629 / NBRC 100127 / Av18) TaxID=572546 RepID=D2REP7_ARCPA|nr:hypothetical protein [Archaeoglobus profundus]ADB58591.1 hypothetical protein Arcpr_1545 [Archaeoglobus profundus DSM 5631]